eukprot:TRINITY_DN5753_c0_g1_i1.p1 TRINITY_DN5753_c0_g1~~TRINITY_DN5753_c0_g1_i1.p1  ORF type:complete len:286 (-),score=67.28 TRINITY_DN5753_c0_g1_i1:10-867(-)
MGSQCSVIPGCYYNGNLDFRAHDKQPPSQMYNSSRMPRTSTPLEGVPLADALQRALDINDIDAMFYVGECYEKGAGATQDDAKAAHWYKQAADRGHSEAKFNLGLLLEKEGNFSEAWKLFYAAGNAGHARARTRVGTYYEHGYEFAKKNDQAAVRFYTLAAASPNPDPEAAVRMGLACLAGRGTEQSNRSAFDWFSRAADLQSPEGFYQLGMCYEKGIGIDRNAETAKKCHTKASPTIPDASLRLELLLHKQELIPGKQMQHGESIYLPHQDPASDEFPEIKSEF